MTNCKSFLFPFMMNNNNKLNIKKDVIAEILERNETFDKIIDYLSTQDDAYQLYTKNARILFIRFIIPTLKYILDNVPNKDDLINKFLIMSYAQTRSWYSKGRVKGEITKIANRCNVAIKVKTVKSRKFKHAWIRVFLPETKIIKFCINNKLLIKELYTQNSSIYPHSNINRQNFLCKIEEKHIEQMLERLRNLYDANITIHKMKPSYIKSFILIPREVYDV